jgi:uncharacterized cupredoxin-like copper-binding protein
MAHTFGRRRASVASTALGHGGRLDEEDQMSAMRLIAALGLGVGLTLTACGDDDDTDGADATGESDVTTLEVASSDALKFEPEALTAPAGEVRIVHNNRGSTTHTFVIDGQDFKLVDDDDGEIDLAAGEYVFYCDVPGHRDAGMEGTLSVGA